MRETNHLLRVLGVAFGLAAVLGSVIGQGILRSPGIVAQASGSPAVLIGLWALGAGIALISALPFAELGAAVPRCGGPISFAGRAYGGAARVVTALTLVMMMISSQAVVVYVLGEFLVRLGVGGGAIGPGGLGIAAMVLFCLVNATGTRASGVAQIVLSAAKGLVLIALVVIFFAQPAAAPPSAPAAAAHGGWLAFGTAMLVIIGTYNGWGDLVIYGEEIENPGKAIPRALFGGIAGVAVIYLAVNLALLHVMNPADMARSGFAAADAARAVFGARGDTILTLFGVLSVGAIGNLGLMTSSRIVFATARDGILPRRLARVSRLGTPLAAMTVASLGTAALLWSGTYLTLSETSSSLAQGVFVLVTLATIGLRRREPDLERPFRVPFYPWSIWFVLLLNLALLAVFVVQDPFDALLGYGLVALLSAGYLLFARRQAEPLAEAAEGAT